MSGSTQVRSTPMPPPKDSDYKAKFPPAKIRVNVPCYFVGHHGRVVQCAGHHDGRVWCANGNRLGYEELEILPDQKGLYLIRSNRNRRFLTMAPNGAVSFNAEKVIPQARWRIEQQGSGFYIVGPYGNRTLQTPPNGAVLCANTNRLGWERFKIEYKFNAHDEGAKCLYFTENATCVVPGGAGTVAKAWYGHPGLLFMARGIDCTEKVRKLLSERTSFAANNRNFTDPCPGVRKTLAVQLVSRGIRSVLSLMEGANPIRVSGGAGSVRRAWYGDPKCAFKEGRKKGSMVTAKVKELLQIFENNIAASNAHFGDPCPGVRKVLLIEVGGEKIGDSKQSRDAKAYAAKEMKWTGKETWILHDVPYSNHEYSSVYNGDPIGHSHGSGSLLSNQAWSARHNRLGEWMRMSLAKPTLVAGVCIRPRAGHCEQYLNQVAIMAGGERIGEFSVNKGQRDRVQIIWFRNPWMTKSITVVPLGWHRHISARIGLVVGRKAARDALTAAWQSEGSLYRKMVSSRGEAEKLPGWKKSKNKIILSSSSQKTVLSACKDSAIKPALLQVVNKPSYIAFKKGMPTFHVDYKSASEAAGDALFLMPDGSSPTDAWWKGGPAIANLMLRVLIDSAAFRPLNQAESKQVAAIREGVQRRANKVIFTIQDICERRAKEAHARDAKSVEIQNEKLRAPAFLPTLHRLSSVQIVKHWSKERDVRDPKQILPEYRSAVNQICLGPKWIAHTKTASILRFVGQDFVHDERVRSSLLNKTQFEVLAALLVQKAYKLKSLGEARRQNCAIMGNNCVQRLNMMFDWLRWRKPYFAMALHYWLKLDNPGSITVKLGEFIDRANRCESAKRLGFDMVVRHAYNLAKTSTNVLKDGKGEEKKGADQKMSKEQAVAKIKGIMEEYIDIHKFNAYKSSIEEPVRAYYNAMGNHGQRDHFNVHGLNWYLAATTAAIGMQLPLLPYMSDGCLMGFATFWHAKGGDRMWTLFRKPENFGRAYEGITPIARMNRASMGGTEEQRFNGGGPGRPRDFANRVVGDDASYRKRWAVYMERLCYFFTTEFFCRKAISVLMQENADNFALLGFRKACDVVFETYKREKGSAVREESFAEYVYDEDASAYDVERVNNFFHYVGITKCEVKPKPRKRRIPSVPEAKVAKKRFDGSRNLLNYIANMLMEKKSQMTIFSECKKLKIATAKEVFAAVRFARANMKMEVCPKHPSCKDSACLFVHPPKPPKSEEGPKPAKPAAPARQKTLEDDDCVICMECKPDTALIPCGHTGLCATCAKAFIGKPCPICRTVATASLKLFRPN